MTSPPRTSRASGGGRYRIEITKEWAPSQLRNVAQPLALPRWALPSWRREVALRVGMKEQLVVA